MAGQKLHEGFGGWIPINNLLEKDVFVAIGNYFEGLESISLDTLNMNNVSNAKIKVRKNPSGFLPVTIEL